MLRNYVRSNLDLRKYESWFVGRKKEPFKPGLLADTEHFFLGYNSAISHYTGGSGDG